MAVFDVSALDVVLDTGRDGSLVSKFRSSRPMSVADVSSWSDISWSSSEPDDSQSSQSPSDDISVWLILLLFLTLDGPASRPPLDGPAISSSDCMIDLVADSASEV